jgi:hypothetical protein
MLRRLATLFLVLAVFCGGLASTACATGGCGQFGAPRMKCCAGEGLRADRSCCNPELSSAPAQVPGALERAPQLGSPAILPVQHLSALAAPVARPLAILAPRSLGPPASLLAQHTALRC